uniref:Uncharacterized protein n=1 Tax=Acrobeloides nanus TaxID=290746 RepID=A0A914CXF2_9BILA
MAIVEDGHLRMRHLKMAIRGLEDRHLRTEHLRIETYISDLPPPVEYEKENPGFTGIQIMRTFLFCKEH